MYLNDSDAVTAIYIDFTMDIWFEPFASQHTCVIILFLGVINTVI